MAAVRDFLVERLARVVRELRPGATFSLYADPLGLAPGRHRVVATAFRSVKTRWVDPESVGVDRMPYCCVLPDPTRQESTVVLDGSLYSFTVPFLLIAWIARSARVDDESTRALERALEEARADLVLAAEAFPIWRGAGAGETDAATERAGPISMVFRGASVAAPDGQTYGEAAVRYDLAYIADSIDA